MKNLAALNKYRDTHLEKAIYGCSGDDQNGLFEIPCKKTNKRLTVLASNGLGWDHVSVSASSRIPLWIEMCFVKDLFFESDETVIQFHPRKEEHINYSPNCLHLWRNQNYIHELPPGYMVGFMEDKNEV